MIGNIPTVSFSIIWVYHNPDPCQIFWDGEMEPSGILVRPIPRTTEKQKLQVIMQVLQQDRHLSSQILILHHSTFQSICYGVTFALLVQRLNIQGREVELFTQVKHHILAHKNYPLKQNKDINIGGFRKNFQNNNKWCLKGQSWVTTSLELLASSIWRSDHLYFFLKTLLP